MLISTDEKLTMNLSTSNSTGKFKLTDNKDSVYSNITINLEVPKAELDADITIGLGAMNAEKTDIEMYNI